MGGFGFQLNQHRDPLVHMMLTRHGNPRPPQTHSAAEWQTSKQVCIRTMSDWLDKVLTPNPR